MSEKKKKTGESSKVVVEKAEVGKMRLLEEAGVVVVTHSFDNSHYYYTTGLGLEVAKNFLLF